MSKEFWASIDLALDKIEAEQVQGVDVIAAILNTWGNPEGVEHDGAAFFAGSGGDRSLWSALSAAGWRRIWSDASYYYVAEHPATGDKLTYCEGDVYPGTPSWVKL